jgi:hypothetical protein
MKSKVKIIGCLFLLGMILGPLMDGFHTHSGTAYYPRPWKWMMAWWVPLLFGTATVTIGLSHLDFDKWLRRVQRNHSWFAVWSGIVCFAALYFASAYLSIDETQKLSVMIVTAFLVWYVLEKTYAGFLFALVIAAIGTAVESLLGHAGLFIYTKPDMFGVPYWLPCLYVAASVAVGNLARKLQVQFGRF